jgi:asparagine synthase (glutamine-hydrolysing)
MCGIAGFWAAAGDRYHSAERARAMADAIRHRGPNDSGTWVDGDVNLALSHRRLSIIDLSPHGHQPMISHSQRYVISFNGEVFNFEELRRELTAAAGHRIAFRGHSDTEVMLAAIDAWGLDAAVRRFVGMFAFALWDRRDKELHLVRDRLGIKPLYYGWAGNTLLFGSELKAIASHPEFRGELDPGAIALLMRHNCVPAPYSIYRGIYKLLPASIATFTRPEPDRFSSAAYWSARDVAEIGLRSPFSGSDSEAIAEADRLLREAVRLRMVADVPLGAFLSGGVDSSSVVALMQAQSDRPVRTFTIGSTDDAFNEAPFAKAVAQHLRTDHTELYVTARDALAVIPTLPTLYDEPFADASQIPTFLVSQLARRHVTIALSGDGGDELFGGYNRHVWTHTIWRQSRHLPLALRRASAHAIHSVPPTTLSRFANELGRVLPARLRVNHAGEKLHKVADILVSRDADAMYHRLASHWNDPEAVVRNAREPVTAITDPARRPTLEDFTDRMLYLDLVTYLPDDILTKVDRASMAVSLEARVPLLDHRVVEFAWSLPRSMKIRAGQSKWLLRQVLYQYVPRHLIERPKSGFGIPLDSWLRGPLRDWAESLLDERRLIEEGIFDAAAIRQRWAEHLSGRRNWQYHLWDVLMFQAWFDEHRLVAGGTTARGPMPELPAAV